MSQCTHGWHLEYIQYSSSSISAGWLSLMCVPISSSTRMGLGFDVNDHIFMDSNVVVQGSGERYWAIGISEHAQ